MRWPWRDQRTPPGPGRPPNRARGAFYEVAGDEAPKARVVRVVAVIAEDVDGPRGHRHRRGRARRSVRIEDDAIGAAVERLVPRVTASASALAAVVVVVVVARRVDMLARDRLPFSTSSSSRSSMVSPPTATTRLMKSCPALSDSGKRSSRRARACAPSCRPDVIADEQRRHHRARGNLERLDPKARTAVCTSTARQWRSAWRPRKARRAIARGADQRRVDELREQDGDDAHTGT